MAIDPKKLAALVKGGGKKPLPASFMKKKKGPLNQPHDMEDDEESDAGDEEDGDEEDDDREADAVGDHPEPDGDEDEEGKEPQDQEGDDGDPMSKLGDFADELRDSASELEAIVEEIDADDLDANPEPSPETKAKIKASIGRIPGEMREGFKKFIKGKSFEDAQDIADQLADEGKVEDPERFAGWLYHASKSV